jgi:hypothetical protein
VEKRAKREELETTMFSIPKNSSVLLDTFWLALFSTEEANQSQIVSFLDPDFPRFLPLKLESESVLIYASGREENEFFIVCRGAIVSRTFTAGDEVVEVANGEPYFSPFMSGYCVLSVFGARAGLVSVRRLSDSDLDDLGKFVVQEMAAGCRAFPMFYELGLSVGGIEAHRVCSARSRI